MRTDYVPRRELNYLLAALTPENRLAAEISEHTGLRINDVLRLPTEKLAQSMTVRELKTGKRRRVTLTKELYARARALAGKVWVFEGRLDFSKHRTRQAVFKDIKKVARAFRLRLKGANLAPHTLRKVYAVEAYKRSGDLKKVQALLQHSSEAVTALYAMADELTDRTLRRRRGR